ncbi:hypothetical protein Trydic_g4978 [Trypoxylus dichotomus]
MGVQGLWRLIEPSGKPVPLETLENKVLAVDVSIWLHQAVKGFQDSKGATIPNAHLLGIFHRVCKLLHYRIKPIFVFDGGVPVLKRQTIAKRNQLKSKNSNDANQLQKQLLRSLLKHSAINAILTDKAKAALEHDIQKANKGNRDMRSDMFQLPVAEIESVDVEDDEGSSSSQEDHSHLSRQWDLYSIDETSDHFKSLPINIRHEILSDLKDTRKQSSWGRIHELPTQSDDFAGYQMKRLLKRHSVQTVLEETEKEMGGCTLSLGELEKLLINHGVITSTSIVSRRIASDEDKRYIYIKNLKEAIEQALDEAKAGGTGENSTSTEGELGVENENSDNSEGDVECKSVKSKADIEFESDLDQAIKLSLQNEGNELKDPNCLISEPNLKLIDETVLQPNSFRSGLEETIQIPLQDVIIETKESCMKSVKSNIKDVVVNKPSVLQKLRSDGHETYSEQVVEEFSGDRLKEPVKLSLESSEHTPKQVDIKKYSDESKSDTNTREKNLNDKISLSLSNQDGLIDDFNKKDIEDDRKQASDSKISESDEYETDLQKAIKLSLEGQSIESQVSPTENSEHNLIDETNSSNTKSKADEEFERDLEAAIKLSLQSKVTTSNDAFDHSNSQYTTSGIFDDDESDPSDDEASLELASTVMAAAKSYMTEYSGLTPAEIMKIIASHSGVPKLKNNGDSVKSNTKISSNSDASRSKKVNLKSLLEKPTVSTFNRDKTKSSVKTAGSDGSTQVETDSNSLIIKNASEINSVELMTDSGSEDDFLEVETATTEPKTLDINGKSGQCMEITIEKVSTLEDDLFSDIFEEKSADNKISPVSKGKPLKISTETVVNESQTVKKGNNSDEKRINIIQNIVLATNPEEGAKNVSAKESELLKDLLKPSKDGGSEKSKLTTTELKKLRTNLAKEAKQLMTEKSSKERLAASITDQMCQEAQELLQLFGVPYVIAPMEAEAQCAFLNEIRLTDGTITDDSDIWLFGGKTVYKNFFNQSKLVMEFQAEDIQHSFKLSRHEMILLALLVGSDYTTGIQGIGPVTALEILAAFPPPKTELTLSHLQLLSGLREFRRWFNTTTNKSGKPTKMALRNKLRNVEISEQFPSLQVVQAYLQPTVETSDEQFSWQKPDLASLIEFAKHKFGWSQTKSEEILKPVLRRLEDTSTQTKITNYFKMKHKIAGDLPQDKLSKRVKKALTKIGDKDSESPEESLEVGANKEKKQTKSKRTKKAEKEGDLPTIHEHRKRPYEVKRNSRKKRPKTPEDELGLATLDEDIKQLQQTKKLSRHKIKEMKIAMNEMLLKAEKAAANEEGPSTSVTMGIRLHRKETIPQKEKEKADVLQKKLKAIEVFRKSKQGPGYIKKKQRNARQPKEDAELSESSDS